jgi:2-polyprenyl-3-methyl-5-hydroxy-6-metoxy-1,4-benzoquinol methylase
VTFSFSETLVACDLCGGKDFAIRDAATRVMQCRRCGYRFTNPRPSQAEIAAAYSAPAQYDGWLAQDAGREIMWSRRWALVKQFAKGKRLLDVGAGIGTFLAHAHADGWDVTGTEISRSAIGIARERYGIALIEGQLEDIPTAGQFDLVTMWHVLEHLPSPSHAVTQCRDLLKTGGLMVVAVPNDSDARWRFQRLKNGKYMPYEELEPGKEIHLSHFTVRVLKRTLESRGFRVERATVDDHYPERSPRRDRLVATYRTVMAGTGMNLGVATLVLARAV